MSTPENIVLAAALLVGISFASSGAARCEIAHGMPCEDNCKDINDGYDFAKDQDTRDLSLCFGHSDMFYRGCAQFIYEAGPATPPPKKKEEDLPSDVIGDQK